jgi:hypothetical protein
MNTTIQPTASIVEMPPGERRKISHLPIAPHQVAYSKYFYCDLYTGTAAALIAAGIVEENMLPGSPGRNKVSVTIGKRKEPGYIYILRRGKRYFDVTKGISSAECRRRAKPVAQQRAAALHESLKDEATYALRFYLSALRTKLMPDDGGGFDYGTLCDFERLAEEMEGVLQNGVVVQGLESDQAATGSGIPAYKEDAPLQAFLQRMAGDLSLVAHETPEDA